MHRNSIFTSSRQALFLVIAAGLVAGCEHKKPVLPTQIVLAEDVNVKTQPIYWEWIGTMSGSVNASIRAQVGGYLLKQTYQEGSFVKQGTVLFQIDPSNYKTALDQAKGTLASKQAAQVKSQQDMDRYKGLVAQGAVSQQEYQNEVQTYQGALADTAAAQAAVGTAQNNLDYCDIKSAIDGVAGIAEAQVGDLISQNTEMTSVSTIDPIKATFNISEQQYLGFLQKYPDQAERELAKKNAVLQLILSDNVPYDQKGKLDIVNNQINQQTGTVSIVGLFPNPNGVLRPGSFVRVRMTGSQQQEAISVPQRAVMQLQTIYMMAVVVPDATDPTTGTISMRTVTVGNIIGSQWVITSGIKSGEKIVVEGTDKVREGQTVKIEPYVDPNAQPPAPATPPSTTPPPAKPQ